MKAFTSIEQSKKLAEILPLESADMYLTNSSIKGEMYIDEFKPVLVPYLRAKDSLDAYSKIVNNMIAWEVIPCWSIAALLDFLPNNQGRYTKSLYWFDDAWHCEYVDEDSEGKYGVTADNPVDACVAMIEELHEQKLL